MLNPVTCIPMYWNAQGLPISLQIVGKPGMDHLTVAVAQALEEDFGGWKPAPVSF